jgi:hypothetical protein
MATPVPFFFHESASLQEPVVQESVCPQLVSFVFIQLFLFLDWPKKMRQ